MKPRKADRAVEARRLVEHIRRSPRVMVTLDGQSILDVFEYGKAIGLIAAGGGGGVEYESGVID